AETASIRKIGVGKSGMGAMWRHVPLIAIGAGVATVSGPGVQRSAPRSASHAVDVGPAPGSRRGDRSGPQHGPGYRILRQQDLSVRARRVLWNALAGDLDLRLEPTREISVLVVPDLPAQNRVGEAFVEDDLLLGAHRLEFLGKHEGAPFQDLVVRHVPRAAEIGRAHV